MKNQNSTLNEAKIQRIRCLLNQIDLAHEGYLLSSGYARADIPEHLRNEGRTQQEEYCARFSEALDGLKDILQEMNSVSKSNMEGK